MHLLVSVNPRRIAQLLLSLLLALLVVRALPALTIIHIAYELILYRITVYMFPAAAGLLSAYPCGTAAFNSQLTLFYKNAGTGRQEWDVQPVFNGAGAIGNTTLVLLRVGCAGGGPGRQGNTQGGSGGTTGLQWGASGLAA